MATRSESTVTTVRVRHVAKPGGSTGRENGPHLSDLREFVNACDGLPDDLAVYIENGYLSESGRHDVTFTATQTVPKAAEQ